MSTHTNPNFAPEGHNGFAAAREDMSSQQNSQEQTNADEHDYDDGLVHDHSWHSSSNQR